MDWETPKAIPRTVSRVSHLETTSTPPNPVEVTRKQIQTELELMKLQDQVERLKEASSRRLCSDTESSGLSYWEEENAELKGLLLAAETRSQELIKSQASLVAKTEKENMIMKSKIQSLKDSNDLLKAEKKRIKSEKEKTSKSITALKSYLKEVPSLEDYNELQASLRTKEAQVRDLRTQVDIKNISVEKIQTKLKSSEGLLRKVTSERDEANLRLHAAEDKLRGYLKRLEEGKDSDCPKARALFAQEKLENLQIENQGMRKYVGILKNKHEADINKRDSEISERDSRIARLREELSAVNEQSIKCRESIDILNSSLKHLQEKAGSTSRRVQVLENELSDSKNSSNRRKETNELISVLMTELSYCLHDIDGLSRLSRMVISGEDPDLTLLLGCERPERPPQPEGGTLLVLQSHSVEIKRIKKEIAEMRQVLADKYAETLGNNMTSCITQ